MTPVEVRNPAWLLTPGYGTFCSGGVRLGSRARTVEADGYDFQPVYTELLITNRGTKTPIQTDGRWVVGHANSWMNNFGELRRNTERRRSCAEFYLALAATTIAACSFIRHAWYTHRWDTRPPGPASDNPAHYPLADALSSTTSVHI